jgi:hypothetical protein
MPATLQFNFREDWRELKRGRPGHRFQDRYERARQAERGSWMKRVMLIGIAVCALAIAVVLAVFPGPAIPFFLISGALLATESRTIAKVMDWIEVRFRRVFAWLKRRWRRLPFAGRIGLLCVGAACSSSMLFFTIRYFRG